MCMLEMIIQHTAHETAGNPGFWCAWINPKDLAEAHPDKTP